MSDPLSQEPRRTHDPFANQCTRCTRLMRPCPCGLPGCYEHTRNTHTCISTGQWFWLTVSSLSIGFAVGSWTYLVMLCQ